MTSETKQKFTLRITQANKTQMVVIIYEILDYYLGEAEENLGKKDIEAFHDSIRHATGCLRELVSSINSESELSGNFLSLYVFCMKQLARADLHHTAGEIKAVKGISNKLYEAYKESVKDDTSAPVMGNTETVYAGLTYGKQDLVVNVNTANPNRGFTV